MRLARTVIRFPTPDREALDRLRNRYFAESGRGLSRASVVRVLVHRALEGADARRASDVLDEPGRPLAQDPNLRPLVIRSAPMPAPRTPAPTTPPGGPANDAEAPPESGSRK